jgi:hypothetical protein
LKKQAYVTNWNSPAVKSNSRDVQPLCQLASLVGARQPRNSSAREDRPERGEQRPHVSFVSGTVVAVAAAPGGG